MNYTQLGTKALVNIQRQLVAKYEQDHYLAVQQLETNRGLLAHYAEKEKLALPGKQGANRSRFEELRKSAQDAVRQAAQMVEEVTVSLPAMRVQLAKLEALDAAEDAAADALRAADAAQMVEEEAIDDSTIDDLSTVDDVLEAFADVDTVTEPVAIRSSRNHRTRDLEPTPA